MCRESIKTVLLNLSAVQQWRWTHREQTVDTAGEGEGATNREKSREIHT